jgi:hypothetical protein
MRIQQIINEKISLLKIPVSIPKICGCLCLAAACNSKITQPTDAAATLTDRQNSRL